MGRSTEGPGAVTAIVLAGGRSARFGSDKLAADVDGVPLLHRAIRAASAVSAEVVVVGAPTGLPVELPSIADVPMRLVRDPERYQGPLAALAHAAAVVAHDRLLLIGGDMPDLQESVLRRLTRWAPGLDGACLVADGWDRPLPLGLAREAAATRAAQLIGDGRQSLRALIASLDLERVPEDEWRALDPEGRSLRDIDRPDDLR